VRVWHGHKGKGNIDPVEKTIGEPIRLSLNFESVSAFVAVAFVMLWWSFFREEI